MISLTDCYRHTAYGEPVVALKSYVMSPFVDEEHVEAVLQRLSLGERGEEKEKRVAHSRYEMNIAQSGELIRFRGFARRY